MSERLVLPAITRRPLSLDAMEMPCADCFVGEPHVCPLLVWTDLVIEQDEWGGWAVTA